MRRLTHEDLRSIVWDPSELAKGARLLDDGALSSLAKHGDKLYADAAGGQSMPYKVTITIANTVSARCTCMAARTRPFCKHAAALLVAWTNAPDAFVESDRTPADRAPQRRMKKGKVDAKAMMAAGIARVVTLVRELSATGVASVAEGRARTLDALSEGLRADRLRRLAGRVSRLSAIVGAVEAGDELPVSVDDYADLVCDLLLTARKLERHLAGEPLEDRHVEELIGKTWRKADRAPVEGLELVEYARSQIETAEGFVVREARFVDAASGVHYSDKQILPGMIARRTPPRPSRAGQVLRGAAGGVFPGYPPRRIDLTSTGEVARLDAETLGRLIAHARPIADVLTAFQDHRRDVFAPGFLPVTVRVDAFLSTGLALDGAHALTVPLEDLSAELVGTSPRALIGDLVLERSLPVLRPRALVFDDHLVSIVPGERREPHAAPAGAAASIAEIRSEMAAMLAQGLASFTARAAAPLVARLRELQLVRPADIVAGIPDKPEAERLEDVVRILQVLGVALVRLVGAITVDRSGLVALPTHPGVLVRPGGDDRWSAALDAARALAEIPPATLLEQVHPWWSHAGLSPLVAAAVAPLPGAVEQAQRVLGDEAAGRAARRTAIRVLCAADLDAAPRLIVQTLGRDGDRSLGAFALDQIDTARHDTAALAQRRAITAELTRALTQSGAADDRASAALALADAAGPAAPLRVAYASDTAKVQEAAAIALGRLCDPDSLDRFLARMDKAALLGLAESGDSRVLPAVRAAVAAHPELARKKVVRALLVRDAGGVGADRDKP